jgi:hypothetical protein
MPDQFSFFQMMLKMCDGCWKWRLRATDGDVVSSARNEAGMLPHTELKARFFPLLLSARCQPMQSNPRRLADPARRP